MAIENSYVKGFIASLIEHASIFLILSTVSFSPMINTIPAPVEVTLQNPIEIPAGEKGSKEEQKEAKVSAPNINLVQPKEKQRRRRMKNLSLLSQRETRWTGRQKLKVRMKSEKLSRMPALRKEAPKVLRGAETR